MQLSTPPGDVPDRPALHVVVTSVASDSHTWNLIYLQLLIEELGHRVTNLGGCVPDELMVDECRRLAPDLVVVSSVNGHGHHDGMRVIGELRACPELRETPIVIGGKLGITGGGDSGPLEELRAAGFDAVFEDGSGIAQFQGFVRALPAAPPGIEAEVALTAGSTVTAVTSVTSVTGSVTSATGSDPDTATGTATGTAARA